MLIALHEWGNDSGIRHEFYGRGSPNEDIENDMTEPIKFVATTPVLASLDIERSVEFFVSKLGFTEVYAVQGQYGIVNNGAVHLHFWPCSDAEIPKATGCRVQVAGIEALYQKCRSLDIVHPNAPLEAKPWGNLEFAILDTDGNLITFHEPQ